MTDWKAFRQALPETAPKERIDWAMQTQKDELGGELCLFSRESVSWLEEEPQKIMTPEDIERREKTRRRTWGARCTCTACGEDFTAGWLRGLKLPGNREIRGIALLQGDDGLLYEGIPDMEDACWRMSAAEIAETDHFDCPLCGADVQLVRRTTGSRRSTATGTRGSTRRRCGSWHRSWRCWRGATVRSASGRRRRRESSRRRGAC